ncbi:MAG: hypothetical protein ACKVU0_04905 [Saprospiraceae bacterium]
MKKMLYLISVLFFMSTCTKHQDYEPIDYSVQMDVRGRLINAKTREPLQNIPLHVEEASLGPKWEWYYAAVAHDTTNSDGTFQLNFKIDYPLHLFLGNLKIDSIPPNYQRGVRIDDEYSNIFCKLDGAGYRIEANNINYLLEIFPLTKAYFVKPNIPTGWEQDTLTLKVINLVETPGELGWECLNINAYPAIFIFRLNNTQKWLTDLKKVRNLFLGDRLYIEYTIRNGTVKKSGSFSKVCAIGDTTAVELPLW